ncbi:hypothetical protein SLEP1_g41971 [Rubroshorea leprosula]|uniref:Phorbol-ester/DAG-type domain-containing protein n=1 Tax=Rubroshorea leprosula TaxID=152421 RepID=A0AAV5L895_9ROSI|nr:hypothetical protein SLEP1_g41971 [Rubroshorea leprosula]
MFHKPISTQFYACIDCKFFLHKSCSELPLNITHPFHDNHPFTLLARAPDSASCNFCGKLLVTQLVYHCSSCKFDLDIKCALLPEFLNGEFPKVDHQIHVEHPLFFIKNLSHEVKLASSRYCSVCLEQLSNASFYTCVVCKLFLHKSCFETELPLNINHPFHEKHTLTLTLLKRESGALCQFCQKSRYPAGLFYHCSSCNFNLDIKCAFLPQFLNGNFPNRDHYFSNVDEHPLFFIQKDLISSNKVEPLYSYCFVCPESLSGSSFYYCPECQLFLHKSCVFEELPLKINHSFHDKHAITLTRKGNNEIACNFCLNVTNGLVYNCSSCEFYLDTRCALLITKDLPKRDRHFRHDEHPLVFVKMLSDIAKINSSCSVCSKPLLGTSFYSCPDCQFFFHKECEAELPTKIRHFTHPQHPLIPKFSLCTCQFCQGKSDGKEIGYQCPSCDFYIHRKCTLPRFVPESKIHDHDHQLIPLLRENLFIICDACGGSGDSAGYFCVECNLMVHWDCILLPKTIKFKLHNHHLLGHNYRLPQKEGERWTCQYCFKKVAAEYGSYKCLHSDCNYILHVSCVKKNKGRLYIEVESENEERDDEASSSSSSASCAVVLGDKTKHFSHKHKESNDEVSSSSSCAVVLGDKIKHFSHMHELVRDNKEIIMNGDEECCDGCALPILTAAYSCPQSECNFSLHKACAQIGEHKPHWAFQDPLRVSMGCHFRCRFCKYDCSGFYCIEDGIRLRGSEIPFITTHEAHAQHSLFCDRDHKGPCSGCGKEMGDYGGYRCTLAEKEENCKFFTLDYRCLTRPLEVQHRFHHHPLKLTYEDPYKDDDGDPFQHMCEICEDRRDPKLWFYRCDECNFDAHPDCIFGEEKDGICLRCIEIPFIITHETHAQHFLFCDPDHKGPCSGCGKEMGDYGGYRCTLAEEEENCKFFALDYECLTRPLTAQHRFHHHLTAQHRFHHHPLKLTYQDPREADGDPSQHICDICEDRRDPKHWFFRCDKCDFDVHPDCVLGEFPFIKRGSLSEYFRCDSHKRPLLHFQSEEHPYPKCVGCGHPCEDQLALKCPHSECNFTLHLNLDCYNSRAKVKILSPTN